MADVGRPTIMTEDTLKKLEEAFLVGASNKEATFYAGISEQTYYNYCKDNPEYIERVEGLKNSPKHKAKINIVKAIEDGDIDTSKWYAERKIKDEFSQRTETTGKDGKDLNILKATPEELELAQQILDIRKQRTTSGQSIGIDTKPLGGEAQD